MVTRRTLIGMFGALGLTAAGVAGYAVTRPEERNVPLPRRRPDRRASGVQYAVMDYNSGRVLLGDQADLPRQPASLTKMMALAVVFDAMNSRDTRFNLRSKVRIPDYISRVGGGIAVFDNLKPGEEYEARDLLIGAGSRSDAYSTLALALHLGRPEVYNWGDGEEKNAALFLEKMNEKAAAIGMRSSHFTVITGLPHAANHSTPHDMARLIRHLQQTYPVLAEHTFGRPTFDIDPVSSSTIHSSSLLRNNPRDIAFAKTGWTDAAGYCLAVMAYKDTTPMVGVVFGADGRAHRDRVMKDILARGLEIRRTSALTDTPRPAP